MTDLERLRLGRLRSALCPMTSSFLLRLLFVFRADEETSRFIQDQQLFLVSYKNELQSRTGSSSQKIVFLIHFLNIAENQLTLVVKS